MRNQRIDLFKCAAIYSVVFLHIKSGLWDWPVTALTRFAVPYFFLVAGYFAWGQDGKKLLRRAGHALLLWAAAVGVTALLCAGMLRREGWTLWEFVRPRLTLEALKDLLACQQIFFPHSYHLWFIGALPLLYLSWWALTWPFRRAGREVPCRLFALLAAGALAVHLFLGEGLALLGRESFPPQNLRNAWLEGLPLFALGAWMARDREKIAGLVSRPLAAAGLLLSAALTLWEQWKAGYQDLFVGSLIFAALLMAVAIRWPQVKEGPVSPWMCRCGGKMTFTIYAVHVPLYGFFQEWSYIPLLGWLVEHRVWAAPAIALLSTLAAVLVERGKVFFYSIFPANRL